MKQLAIIGASGHGKVVADIARLNGYEKIVFLDDFKRIESFFGYEVIGRSDLAMDKDCDAFVAIGNGETRKAIMEKLENVVTLIHPNAVVAEKAKIGRGTVIMAGAVINPGVCIGDGVIVNTCASVDHDSVIGDYSHISVGTHIAGTVNIGKNNWIGMGAAVANNINIVDDCIIGAGAVVIDDIYKKGTYVGVPARWLHE